MEKCKVCKKRILVAQFHKVNGKEVILWKCGRCGLFDEHDKLIRGNWEIDRTDFKPKTK